VESEISFKGEGATLLPLLKGFSQEAPKGLTPWVGDLYVFFDPLSVEFKTLREGIFPREASARGILIRWIPVHLLPGSLPWGDLFLATGRLFQGRQPFELNSFLWGLSQDEYFSLLKRAGEGQESSFCLSASWVLVNTTLFWKLSQSRYFGARPALLWGRKELFAWTKWVSEAEALKRMSFFFP
jgi:hypothetical protein